METTSHLVSDQITLPVGDGMLSITIGPFAGLANQSIVCRYGDTEVLIAVTMSKDLREGTDFFPLTVNFEEKMYAAGKIPGGFIKKEGRPSDQSILTSRAIDRSIRPLFPGDLRNEVQVVVLTLCADQKNPPDIPAIIGTAAALHVSDIPFREPIGAVRVALDEDKFVVNPSFQLLDESPLDLIVVASRDRIVMIEAGSINISEETMLEAISFAHQQIIPIIDAISDLRDRVGKEKFVYTPPQPPPDNLVSLVENYLEAHHTTLIGSLSKKERDNIIREFQNECLLELFGPDKTEFTSQDILNQKHILTLIEEGLKKRMRARILNEGLRIDNRRCDDIRPIWAEVAVIQRAHGSAVFTRGETQVMTIATLGAIGDKQKLDDIGVYEYKRYMHHYYAPPFCYGETGFMRGPGRREIGHGALAEKALKSVIPPEEEFPYTLRVVTEVLSSNGSTSMASVCGSTLSLMDAGVPISEPVAGIAMGLITDPDSNKFAVLSDLLGMEDHFGDMDFKVAGTKHGINAIQLDLKIPGIPIEIVKATLYQAKTGREYIMDKLLSVISEPRPELSPYAPRIITVIIDPQKIGELIGPGGKVVRGIIEKTGVEIDIEDDGRVYITSTDAESSEQAVAMIKEIVHEPEVGDEYDGRVVKITQFGAFIKLTPSRDGLLHVSNICDKRIERVEDVLSVGDIIRVKVKEIDEETGKISLTRRGLMFPDGDPLLERIASVNSRRHRANHSDAGHSGGGRSSGGNNRDRRGGPPPRRPNLR